MRLILLLGALLMSTAAPAQQPRWTLVIHGGAGVIERDRLTPEQDKAIRAALNLALDAGSAVLARGGASLDAVEAAVKVLEDDPNFNAGRGAVFTYEGVNELDAAIMRGDTRAAGAVTGVTRTKNPISLARAVMEKSPHVFLSREGADRFSAEQGLEQVDPSWFATPERKRQLEEMKAKQIGWYDVDLKYGTVGAVAVDARGRVAAATSTGGLTGKRWGRIGDSPIIGAGTYADDRACAVSATGAGEFFIRIGVAHEICARIRIKKQQRDLNAAADAIEHEAVGAFVHPDLTSFADLNAADIANDVLAEVAELGGSGGVVVVTPDGQAIYSFNTPGMYRGRATGAGKREVAIYGDE